MRSRLKDLEFWLWPAGVAAFALDWLLRKVGVEENLAATIAVTIAGGTWMVAVIVLAYWVFVAHFGLT